VIPGISGHLSEEKYFTKRFLCQENLKISFNPESPLSKKSIFKNTFHREQNKKPPRKENPNHDHT